MPASPATPERHTFALDLSRAIEAGESPTATLRPALPAQAETTLPALSFGPDGDLAPLGLLGQGGMGVVLAAHDRVLQRVVATKRPTEATAAVQALVREARTLARMDHPNVVPVYALGRDEQGTPVLVMKRVEGHRWTELLRAGRDVEKHVDIALAVADALRFAHAQGVIHRDLKPDNVMVGGFGEVYLMDWGCAASGENLVTAELCGTPSYLAPEMLEPGAAITPATDVFLLGATLHRALTGLGRHPGGTLAEVIAAARVSAPYPYPPDFPPELGDAINRACAPRPKDRFPTIGAFADALRDWKNHRAAAALAATALAELPGLREAVARATPDVDTRFAEMRVGVHAALRAWPGDHAARSGLSDAADLMIAHKLSRGELDGAEALLGDLAPDKVDARRAQIAIARAERRTRDEQARAYDLAIAARDRVIAGAVLLGMALLGIPAVFLVKGSAPFTSEDVVATGAFSLLSVLLAFVPFWRRLSVTRVSRGLMGAIAMVLACSFVSRVLGYLMHEDPASTLRSDAFWIGGAFLVVAITVEGSFVLAAVPYLLAGVAIALRPADAGAIFPLGALPSTVLGFLVLLRLARRPAPPTGG